MTTQTAVDSIESLLGESREAVLSREKTSLEALVHARSGRIVIFGAGSTGVRALRCLGSIGIRDMLPEYNAYKRTCEGDGWQAVAYAVPKQRVLA